MSTAGHNSRVAADKLRSFVARIENMQDQIDLARLNLKEVYDEAKGRGYDVKTLRRIISIRKKDPAVLAEQYAVLELYGAALGMEVFL